MINTIFTAIKDSNFDFNCFSRIFCLVYIIQLTLKDIVVYIKIAAQNSKIITEWKNNEKQQKKYLDIDRYNGIYWILKKINLCNNLCNNSINHDLDAESSNLC